jgi:ABC-type transport system involved in multi-copper enzyme maturation permease subunit
MTATPLPSPPAAARTSRLAVLLRPFQWAILRSFVLAGPIFTKELRVASRRRRNYALRFVYLAMLGVFVAFAWVTSVEMYSSSGAMSVYRMPQAGRVIVSTIAWFQFVAIQLIAIVLLSTSVSDEVYHRTLPALLSTPLSNLQILLGKLGSKMLHLVSLLLISVPLLGLLRVFGGVPWGYVIASTCITLTAGLLAACVSMFYSVLFRRAYSSILLTMATLFFLYCLLPILLGMFAALGALAGLTNSWAILMHFNPIASMAGIETQASGMRGLTGVFFWPLHCLFMVGCSVAILLPCVGLVRKVAIRRAMGGGPENAQPFSMPMLTATAAAPPTPAGTAPLAQAIAAPPPLPAALGLDGASTLSPSLPAGMPPIPGPQGLTPPLPGQRAFVPPIPSAPAEILAPSALSAPAAPAAAPPLAAQPASPPLSAAAPATPAPPAPISPDLASLYFRPKRDRPIQEIKGSPIVWKELRTTHRRGWLARVIAASLIAGLVVMTYCMLASLSALRVGGVQAAYAVLFLLFGLADVTINSPTGISSEKEARSLPILLTTPLGDWEIIYAKMIGVFRRCAIGWVFLFAHALIFTLGWVLHPVILLHLAILALWVTFFLTASGLYFSSRFKKTTSAVVANIGLAITLWVLVPLFASPFWSGGGSSDLYGQVLSFQNPFSQVVLLTVGADRGTGSSSDGSGYPMPGRPNANAWEATAWAAGTAAAYALIGAFLLWRAKQRLRRDIF